MSGPITATDLDTLPKVELHVHLEGTVRADTAILLARRHGLEPEAVLPLVDGGYPARFTSFEQFVSTFVAVSATIRTPDDLATVAADFARHQAEQNIAYTEATFTAATLVRQGWEPAAMWAALRDGLAAARPYAEVVLIIDAVRDAGVEHAEQTIRLVEEADAPIVGLGLSGIENSVHERDFARLRTAADRLGLGLAIHAGETGDAANVRAALDELGADRIGHGIAAVHDAELLDRLVREATPLEVCPSSNVVLELVAGLDAHPFGELWRAGANVTVNSDDPPFFATTLTDELGHAARLADLTRSDLAELQRRAARAAFTSPQRRDELLAAIDGWERGDA